MSFLLTSFINSLSSSARRFSDRFSSCKSCVILNECQAWRKWVAKVEIQGWLRRQPQSCSSTLICCFLISPIHSALLFLHPREPEGTDIQGRSEGFLNVRSSSWQNNPGGSPPRGSFNAFLDSKLRRYSFLHKFLKNTFSAKTYSGRWIIVWGKLSLKIAVHRRLTKVKFEGRNIEKSYFSQVFNLIAEFCQTQRAGKYL